MRRRRPRRSTGRGAQLQLLLAVVRRLTADPVTVDDLAETRRVHRRTAWRVLATMRAARLPLVAGRDPQGPAWRYRLRRGWWEAAP